MSRKEDSLRFQARGGHIECQKQVAGRRYHVSWETWDEMEADVIAFFKLREAGISIHELAKQLDAGVDPKSLNNLGPKGLVAFESFCDGDFKRIRERMPSWNWERGRIAFLKKVGTFAGRQMHTIQRHEIHAWYREYCQRPTVTSDNTRANMLKMMRAIFKIATELGYLRENPARDVHAPQVPDTQSRALAHGECVRLYAAADERVRPWILFTLYTGLRPVEIERLTTAQVKLSERKISVVGNTRKNRTRDIYIHDDLEPVVRELASTVPNLPLFRDMKGKPLAYPHWRFVRARQAANLDDVTFYELRHTFETWLHDADVSEEVRAYVMGHKPHGMTARYTHVKFEKVQAAIAKLASITNVGAAVRLVQSDSA